MAAVCLPVRGLQWGDPRPRTAFPPAERRGQQVTAGAGQASWALALWLSGLHVAHTVRLTARVGQDPSLVALVPGALSGG